MEPAIAAKAISSWAVSAWRCVAQARALRALVAAIALTTAGCTHTLRLKAVDAGSERPLAGVETSWREDKVDLLLGAHHHGATNLQPSTEDGVVVAENVHPKWVSRLELTHAGYAPLYGIYSRGALALGAKTNANVRGERFILEPPVVSARQWQPGCLLRPGPALQDTLAFTSHFSARPDKMFRKQLGS